MRHKYIGGEGSTIQSVIQIHKRYVAAALLLVLATVISTLPANAAQLTRASVRLGRMGISASNPDFLVTFRLNTAPTTVAKVTVTFPAGFTVTTATPTVSTANFPATPASITVPPGALTAASTAGTRTVVVSGLTSASLNNTNLYGFYITTAGTVTNPATAGQYNVTVESDTAASALVDSTTTPVFIFGTVANQDQVVVSASVAANFSFSLSANADTVPKVDPSAIQTSTGVTMTVGTNSPLGYTAYVKSANAALTSATSPGTPIGTGTFNAAPDTVTAGTTMYGLVPSTGTACSTCTGTLTYDAEYNVTLGTQAGSFNGAGGFASFVSRNGYTNADQVLIRERAAVATTVGYANDYTDTLTIVAAGNF